MVQTITNPPAEKLHPAYLRLQKLTDLSYIMNRSGVSSEIKNSRGNMDYDKNTKKLRRSYHQANRSLKRHIMECFLERYKWVEFNSILDKYVPFESKRNKKRNRSTEETLIIKIAARLRGDPDQNEDLLLKSKEDVTDYFNKLSLADDVDDNLNSLNNDDAQLPAEGGEEAATTVDEHNPNEDAPLVLDCHANGVDDDGEDDGDGQQQQQQQQQHQQHQQQLLQRMPATSTSTPSSSSSSLSSDESKLSSSDELPDESLNESTVSSSSSLLSSASSLSSKVGGGEEDDDDDDDDYIAVDDDDDDDDDDDVTTTDIITKMKAPTDNPTTLNRNGQLLLDGSSDGRNGSTTTNTITSTSTSITNTNKTTNYSTAINNSNGNSSNNNKGNASTSTNPIDKSSSSSGNNNKYPGLSSLLN